MRTYKASQKQSSDSNPLVSRPFVVQPKPKEDMDSPKTQGYESQMPHFTIFNPEGERSPVQPKLAIGAPGDRYEQEADQTAKLVVQKINAPATIQSTQEQSVKNWEEQSDSIHIAKQISASVMPKSIQRSLFGISDHLIIENPRLVEFFARGKVNQGVFGLRSENDDPAEDSGDDEYDDSAEESYDDSGDDEYDDSEESYDDGSDYY
ncbi:hypothetical protein CLI64_05655 [Nostoc sp. CENA543]|uniref:hypothetical protein n=1 Tax=Nostoc sp. CENA543 TaxID=1869241 RepID=UPI000CA0965D|nr:hypothetical protein [Nostoc sp. CENA543]AUS99914.1 hypothetical protein CLI64_05655 [Nostoc sp. CENA543]